MIVMGLADNMVPGLPSGKAVGGAPYPHKTKPSLGRMCADGHPFRQGIDILAKLVVLVGNPIRLASATNWVMFTPDGRRSHIPVDCTDQLISLAA